jgi:hypothetical protein
MNESSNLDWTCAGNLDCSTGAEDDVSERRQDGPSRGANTHESVFIINAEIAQ